MQKFLASGRMIKDAEIKMMQSGKQLASFTIAVQRDYKNKETGNYESDFFNCVAFGFTAEYVGNYLTKGSKLIVEGKLQNDSWEKDGVKHYSTKVIAEKVEGCDSKKKQSEQGASMEGFGSQVMDEDVPF